VFDAADLATESAFWAGMLDGQVLPDDTWHSVFDADGQWCSGMVDEDVYCIDILTQVSAITKALERGRRPARRARAALRPEPRPPGRTQPTPTRWSPEATRAIDRLLKS
jgi:Metal-sensitive transcriptional repressor